jgi:hypothetical protein
MGVVYQQATLFLYASGDLRDDLSLQVGNIGEWCGVVG